MASASVFDLRDTSTFRSDGTLGLTGRPIRGERVVLEWCARAIITRPRSLRWDRTRGATIRALENADLSATELGRAKQAFDIEIAAVDFVAGVSSRLTQDPRTLLATYAAGIAIVGAGVYPLAVSIDQAGKAIATFGGIQ